MALRRNNKPGIGDVSDEILEMILMETATSWSLDVPFYQDVLASLSCVCKRWQKTLGDSFKKRLIATVNNSDPTKCIKRLKASLLTFTSDKHREISLLAAHKDNVFVVFSNDPTTIVLYRTSSSRRLVNPVTTIHYGKVHHIVSIKVWYNYKDHMSHLYAGVVVGPNRKRGTSYYITRHACNFTTGVRRDKACDTEPAFKWKIRGCDLRLAPMNIKLESGDVMISDWKNGRLRIYSFDEDKCEMVDYLTAPFGSTHEGLFEVSSAVNDRFASIERTEDSKQMRLTVTGYNFMDPPSVFNLEGDDILFNQLFGGNLVKIDHNDGKCTLQRFRKGYDDELKIEEGLAIVPYRLGPERRLVATIDQYRHVVFIHCADETLTRIRLMA